MQKSVKSFDGTRIAYSVKRKGKVFFVFIHGLGSDYTVWKKITNFISEKGYSTIAIDLRGHGHSERPQKKEAYILDNFARDINEVLLKEKVKKFVICGHCYGGVVAITFQKLFPNKAEAYVLISTTSKAPNSMKLLTMNPLALALHRLMPREAEKKHRNFDIYIGTGDWDVKRLYSDITTTSIKSWFSTFRSMSKFDGRQSLMTMDKPCLILAGEKDSILRIKESKKIHSLVKRSELKIIPNENHIIPITNLQAIQREIALFLDSLRIKSR